MSTSIQGFLAKSNASKSKTSLTPGTYNAIIKNVSYDDRYVDGAIILTYEFYANGKKAQFTERIIDNPRFERTRAFGKQLSDNNFEDVEEIVGHQVKIVLKWNFLNNGKRELSIVDRVFLPDDIVSENTSQGNTEEGGKRA